jgi:hypothetical protein
LVDVPHRLLHQLGSGVQHVWFARQTPPSPQLVSGQVKFWLQLFVTAWPHLPMQGVTLSGVQQVSVERQMSVGDAQFGPPPLPQGTGAPQLLFTVPQVRPAQVVVAGSAVQLHALSRHESPPSQPPQLIASLQLSMTIPQRLLQMPGCGMQPASRDTS